MTESKTQLQISSLALFKTDGVCGALKKCIGKGRNLYQRKIRSNIRRNRILKNLNTYFDQKSVLSEASAAEHLESIYRIEKMPFSQETTLDIRYDLMVVVPVYNMENYLKACIESVLNQKTRFSYITVVINDGSADGSNEILRRYDGLKNVLVIRQENRGFSGARNRALENIYGRYVMFVDADDILADGAIESLMDAADRKNADLVEGSYMMFGEGQEDWIPAGKYSAEQQADPRDLTGYPWGKVIRSDLFRSLCFPQNIWFEDTIMHCLLYPMCNKIWWIPDIVYCHRDNPAGISATAYKNVKCLDTYWITEFCLEEKVKRGQEIGTYENELFLNQLRTNQRRLRMMPADIQESVFVLSCVLYETYFKGIPVPAGARFRLLNRALTARSYKAFKCIMENWELLA